MYKVLAVDMGATSIRCYLATYADGELHLEEVNRFRHQRVTEQGRVRWQWDLIMDNIVSTILRYADELNAVAVDTWGVDCCFLDSDGELIENPISYRDPQHIIGYDKAQQSLSLEEIYSATGNQLMSINTLFQLLSLRELAPETYKKIAKILFLPDFINYQLSGEKFNEQSIISTSQMLDLNTGELAHELLKHFDISENLFSEIIGAGKIVGSTKNSRIPELQKYDIAVVAVNSHDTASSVLVTKAFDDAESLFLSSGTWSLIGAVSDQAVVNADTYRKQLTNELGYQDKILLLQNVTGLYLVEKLKQQLDEAESAEAIACSEQEFKQIQNLDFSMISEHVAKTLELTQRIDVDAACFAQNEYDALAEIKGYLQSTDQTEPKRLLDYFTIVYLSLADKYQSVRRDLEQILNRRFKKLHIIGGGAKAEVFCQIIADTLQLEVVAGPSEASVLGNVLVQLIAVDAISANQLSDIINQMGLKQYIPKEEA